MADGVGFEPTERLLVRQVSNLVLSASQSPILIYFFNRLVNKVFTICGLAFPLEIFMT